MSPLLIHSCALTHSPSVRVDGAREDVIDEKAVRMAGGQQVQLLHQQYVVFRAIRKQQVTFSTVGSIADDG